MDTTLRHRPNQNLDYKIVNIVVTYKTRTALNLYDLRKKDKYVEFEPELQRFAFYKIPQLHNHISIYKSGTITSSGCNSFKKAKEDILLTLKNLELD